MDKRLIYILIGIIVIHLGYDIFTSENLKEALSGMKDLKNDLEDARTANQSAQAQTNEILRVVKEHREQLLRLEQDVDRIDLTRQDNERQFLAERRLLRKEIDRYNRMLDSLRRELPMQDTPSSGPAMSVKPLACADAPILLCFCQRSIYPSS